ncbi:MAG: hypothetical protein Q7R76_00160 [Candidatus Woesearchaeota archaeon]|nr:hypothetical protein [Candidatus Woesearchaeota archaeon]
MVKHQLKRALADLTFLFSFLFSFLPTVSAAPFAGDIGNVGDTVMQLFYPIFGVNMLESANFAFWAKFLIWILLFALFYAVFRMLFKENKNIAVTLGVIVAAISTLGMPESMLRGIIESYTFFATFILYIAPIAGTLFLMHKFFGEDNRFNHIIKAVLFFLLAALLTHFTSAMQTAGIPSFNITQGIAGFATSVCIIAGLYHIFKAIFAGPAGAAPTAPTWPFGTTPAHPGPTPVPPNFTARLDALEAAITAYNNIRETALRVPAMRDLLNANAAGGIPPYPTPPYPAPVTTGLDWGPYNAAQAALDGEARRIITHLQHISRHPDIGRITNAESVRFDNLRIDFGNATAATLNLLHEFERHRIHNDPSPW